MKKNDEERYERCRLLSLGWRGDGPKLTDAEKDEYQKLKAELEQEEKVKVGLRKAVLHAEKVTAVGASSLLADKPDSEMVEGDDPKGNVFWVTRHHSYDSRDDNPLAGISEKDWSEQMLEMVKDIYAGGSVDFMACIFHDADIVPETGAPVQLHFHTFVRFKAPHNRSFVKDLFGATSNGNCQKPRSNLSMARYVIHVSADAVEKNKTIYSRDKVITFNCDYNEIVKAEFWKKAKNKDNPLELVDRHKAKEIADQLGMDIRNGLITQKQAVARLEEKAGYAWVRQLSYQFNDDHERYTVNEVDRLKENGRKLRNVHIMGDGGIGKSSLAEVLAKKMAGDRGFMIATSTGVGKTPDALNMYKGEAVVIHNEASSTGLMMDEHNTVYDPNKYASVPARGCNKDFIGHTNIFTNSVSPIRYTKDIVLFTPGGKKYRDPNNKRELNAEGRKKHWQVRRRYRNFMVLMRDPSNDDFVQAHIFNLRTGVLLANGKEYKGDGEHIHVGYFTFQAIPDEPIVVSPEAEAEMLRLLDVSVKGVYKNAVTIEEFLEKHNMVEVEEDDMMTHFLRDVVSECKWTLLPTTFLYELYKSFRYKYYENQPLMDVQEFAGTMAQLLTGWEWKQSVRSSGKMDADEPLITEYGLDRPGRNGTISPWICQQYNGDNPAKKREFVRKEKYRGFEKKTDK